MAKTPLGGAQDPLLCASTGGPHLPSFGRCGIAEHAPGHHDRSARNLSPHFPPERVMWATRCPWVRLFGAQGVLAQRTAGPPTALDCISLRSGSHAGKSNAGTKSRSFAPHPIDRKPGAQWGPRSAQDDRRGRAAEGSGVPFGYARGRPVGRRQTTGPLRCARLRLAPLRMTLGDEQCRERKAGPSLLHPIDRKPGAQWGPRYAQDDRRGRASEGIEVPSTSPQGWLFDSSPSRCSASSLRMTPGDGESEGTEKQALRYAQDDKSDRAPDNDKIPTPPNDGGMGHPQEGARQNPHPAKRWRNGSPVACGSPLLLLFFGFFFGRRRLRLSHMLGLSMLLRLGLSLLLRLCLSMLLRLDLSMLLRLGLSMLLRLSLSMLLGWACCCGWA